MRLRFIFSIYLFSCSRTVCWKSFLFSTELIRHLYWKSVNFLCESLFLNPILSIDQFIYFYASAKVAYHHFTVNLKSAALNLPYLFYFFNVVLAILSSLYFHMKVIINLSISGGGGRGNASWIFFLRFLFLDNLYTQHGLEFTTQRSSHVLY